MIQHFMKDEFKRLLKNYYAEGPNGERITYCSLAKYYDGWYFPVIKDEHFYMLALHLSIAMMETQPICILDPDVITQDIHPDRINKPVDVEDNNSGFWVTFYTSGTTGKPKKVSCSYDDLRINNTDKVTGNRVWGLCYPLYSYAGLSVFVNAFLRVETVINLYGLDRDEIMQAIDVHGITHLSATPTWYLMNTSNDYFPNVRSIIFGGEPLTNPVFDNVRKCFPNARTSNIYASSENGIMARSKTPYFKKDRKFTFKPIPNKKRSKQNRKHKVIYYKGRNTGDIGLAYPGGLFAVTGRIDDIINVMGYNVNLVEVENKIRGIEGYEDATLSVIETSVGNILVLKTEGNKHLKNQIALDEIKQAGVLKPHEMPRIIVGGRSILTKTMKVKRK